MLLAVECLYKRGSMTSLWKKQLKKPEIESLEIRLKAEWSKVRRQEAFLSGLFGFIKHMQLRARQ